MLTGRAEELDYLKEYYGRKGSHLLIFYGPKSIGKTAILREFTRGRPCHYHMARACSEKEHLAALKKLGERVEEFAQGVSFPHGEKFPEGKFPEGKFVEGKFFEGEFPEEGFPEGKFFEGEFPEGKFLEGNFFEKKEVLRGNSVPREKGIIIVEEFQRMVRAGEAVAGALFSLSRQPEGDGGLGVLLILTSSSVSWVENDMVSKIGESARAIADVYKVRELGFPSLRNYFPAYSARQCMEVYAILGGVPGWWEYFDEKVSVRENVCREILEKAGRLHHAVDYLSFEELREPAVYSTILAALAAGMEKLNDLYRHTGFSRAKLSVYLNNLIGMNWVEKVFSFEPGDMAGKKNGAGNGAKKGIYRICNCYVKFYYTYLYTGEDRLFRMSAQRFYNTFILPDRDRYMQDSLRKICMQHIEACGRSGELPVRADRIGSWLGKKGRIDVVVQEAGGDTLLALCQASRMGMAFGEYREMMEAAQKAGFRADYVWLYAELFEDRIVREAERKGNITLVDLKAIGW